MSSSVARGPSSDPCWASGVRASRWRSSNWCHWGIRGRPPSLARPPANRPWRTTDSHGPDGNGDPDISPENMGNSVVCGMLRNAILFWLRIRDFTAKCLRTQPVTRTAPEPFPQPFPQRQERALFSTQPGGRGHDSTSPVSTACCRPPPASNLRCSRPSGRQPSVQERLPESQTRPLPHASMS